MLIAALCATLPALAADEVVVSDDGRQVRLNADGTWVQLSQDRFATDAAGRRIRLRADGTWSVVQSEATAPAAAATPPARQFAPVAAAAEVALHLKRVSILRRKIERAKSVHDETRMRYVVGIVNHTAGRLQIGPDLKGKLKATSSRGGDFPIIALTPPAHALDPGEEGELEIWVEGSPRWWGVKYLSLEVAAGALGNPVERVLNKAMDEVERTEVERF